MPFAKLPLVLGLLMWGPFVVAQNTLGELLDTGARKLSVDEFKQELVQRVIVGPSPTGGSFEVIYTTSGEVAGTGILGRGLSPFEKTRIVGMWKTDGTERICTSLRFSAFFGSVHPGGAGTAASGSLPPRCQFWFKLGDTYFLSDSDSDRSAKVLSRTFKQ